MYRKSKQTFYYQYFFLLENRAVYEIMGKKYGKAGQATDDNITPSMHFEC